MTNKQFSPSLLWRDYFSYWDLPRSFPRVLEQYLALGPQNEEELAFAIAVEQMPKVELHVHLEAAVPAAFYAELNQYRGLFPLDQLPAERAPFVSLREFINAWLDNCRLVDDEQIFRKMSFEFVRLRSCSNIVYTEAYISPFDFSFGRKRLKTPEKPLDYRRVLENYLIGLKDGLASYPGVKVRLIVDTLWLSSDAECDQMLSVLLALFDSDLAYDSVTGEPLIVGIGLGGGELTQRAQSKVGFIESCRNIGLKLDIHSGETTSEEEHLHTLDVLKPDRIAHGIAPAARPMYRDLASTRARFFTGGIAACPISNILTGAFGDDLSQHPLRQMLDSGIPVCVNTDDPLLFGTNLTLEFLALRRSLGFDLAMVKKLMHAAANMAFVPLTI